MKIVHYPEGLTLSEYLHIEQELVKRVEEPMFFTWIVAPTVIYGRHQQAEAELNETYCREHGIAVVQRKSGGGCVYADRGNLMLSYITPDTHSERVFANFLGILVRALKLRGLDAVSSSHNDVLVSDRKVSGCACFAAPTGTIVHGTLLYDVDLEAMLRAITPAAAKLKKHGVASVRQRVVNLRSLTDSFAHIVELREYIENFFETE